MREGRPALRGTARARHRRERGVVVRKRGDQHAPAGDHHGIARPVERAPAPGPRSRGARARSIRPIAFIRWAGPSSTGSSGWGADPLPPEPRVELPASPPWASTLALVRARPRRRQLHAARYHEPAASAFGAGTFPTPQNRNHYIGPLRPTAKCSMRATRAAAVVRRSANSSANEAAHRARQNARPT